MLDVLSDWVNWMLLQPRSKSTITGYTWEVRKLVAYYPDKRVEDYTREDLIAFLAWRRQTCGDAAINRAVCGLKAFFQFARPGQSPAEGIPAPKPKKRLQRTLSFEQAFAVLAACDTSTSIGIRDLALISLMLDSGIRASEVCRLRVDKLDLNGRKFHVIVKGGKEEPGPFGVLTANYLSTWLTVRERIAREDVSTVFVGVGGLHPGGPLTTDGLRRIFHSIGKRAGLAAFSPHDLRRTFATMMTLLEAPSRMSQIWGRWANLQEFERYTQALLSMHDRLRSEFEKYSPVSGVMRGWFDEKS